ncbi:MAG: hypothetical protein Kow00129_03300 [Thermoleophilia bacterium]
MLLWLGYLGMRLSGRFRVPVVTSFLLLGIVAGPSGLNFISREAVDSLSLVEPVALGLITFSAGERLLLTDLGRLGRRHRLAIVLEALLPSTLVGIAAFLVTGRAGLSLALGSIAGTSGIATVMATLKESNARGGFTSLLTVVLAAHNVLAILAFSLLLPLAVVFERSGGISRLYFDSVVGIVGSVLLGVLAGMIMARFIGRIRTSGELSVFVLAHLLVAVSLAHLLGYSVLLTGLTTGIVAVNRSGGERERERLFTSLSALEAPLIAVFFLWAGAGLHLGALAGVGFLAVSYVAARAVGKVVAPIIASRLGRGGPDHRLEWLGVALLPQAGVAIGLGIIARDLLPVSGNEVLTVVLAAVVVFELTGPLAVHRAVNRAGEAAGEGSADQPITLPEALRALEARKGLLVVVTDKTTSLWQLASVIRLADGLNADLAVLPIEGPEGSSKVPVQSGDAGSSRRYLSAEPVELLRFHAESHEHGISVLPAVREDGTEPDRMVSSIVEAAERADADLLILAWSREHRRLFAPAVVDRSGRPVVELPGQREAEAEAAPAARPVVRQAAGRAVRPLSRVWTRFRRFRGVESD